MGASTYEWLYYIVFYNPKYYISVLTEIGCVDRFRLWGTDIGCVDRNRLAEPISVVWNRNRLYTIQ